MSGLRKQVPSTGYDWLYKDFEEDNREFSKLVYLGVNDTPWSECTQAERERQWKEAHEDPEPEEV